jgi:hypothetical protein
MRQKQLKFMRYLFGGVSISLTAQRRRALASEARTALCRGHRR